MFVTIRSLRINCSQHCSQKSEVTVSAVGDCGYISDSGVLQCRNTVYTIHSGALDRQCPSGWCNGKRCHETSGVCHKRIVTSCMTHDMKLDILVSSTLSSKSIGGFKRYESACKTDTKLLLNGIITTWVRQIHDSLPHGGESHVTGLSTCRLT